MLRSCWRRLVDAQWRHSAGSWRLELRRGPAHSRFVTIPGGVGEKSKWAEGRKMPPYKGASRLREVGEDPRDTKTELEGEEVKYHLDCQSRASIKVVVYISFVQRNFLQ